VANAEPVLVEARAHGQRQGTWQREIPFGVERGGGRIILLISGALRERRCRNDEHAIRREVRALQRHAERTGDAYAPRAAVIAERRTQTKVELVDIGEAVREGLPRRAPDSEHRGLIGELIAEAIVVRYTRHEAVDPDVRVVGEVRRIALRNAIVERCAVNLARELLERAVVGEVRRHELIYADIEVAAGTQVILVRCAVRPKRVVPL